MRAETGDDSPQIGGVLLAAGESNRFGQRNKLLAAIDESPIVREAAKNLRASTVDSVVAILGHEAESVREALEGLQIGFRTNEAYAEGQSTSVVEGIAAARNRQWDAVVFALGDMPFVATSSVDAVIDAYIAGAGTVVAPTYRGKRGNPVLFDQTHYRALATVTGDRGGRELVRSMGTEIAVDDPGVRQDIDKPDDLD